MNTASPSGLPLATSRLPRSPRPLNSRASGVPFQRLDPKTSETRPDQRSAKEGLLEAASKTYRVAMLSTLVAPTRKTLSLLALEKPANLRNRRLTQDIAAPAAAAPVQSHRKRDAPASGETSRAHRVQQKPVVRSEDAHYPYEAHVGDPCSAGCLDHDLICGHKAITLRPEHCASNCCNGKSSSFHLPNIRNMDKPFVCMTCITRRLGRDHAARMAGFQAELEVVATGAGRSESWIGHKLGFVEQAWREQSEQEMDKMSSEGRFCHAPYVDEQFVVMVARVNLMNKHEPMTWLPDVTNPHDGDAMQPAEPIPAVTITREVEVPFRRQKRRLVEGCRMLPVAVYSST